MSDNKMKAIGLKGALFWTLFLAALVPPTAISVISYQSEKERLEVQVGSTLGQTAKDQAEAVSAWLEMNSAAMRSIGKSVDLYHEEGQAGAEQENYLKEMQKQYPWIYAFYMIDSKGMQYLRSDGSTKMNDVKDRDYFKKMAAGEKYAYQVSVSKATGKPALLMAVPALSAGPGKLKEKATTYLGAGANMDAVSQTIANETIGSSGLSFLVGAQGEYLAHKRFGLIGTDSKGHPGLAGEGLQRGEVAGVPVVAISAKLGNGMAVVSQMDESEAFAPLAEVRWRLFGQLGWSLGLSVLLALLLGVPLSRGLEKVTKLSEQLAKASSVDEIERIEGELSKVGGFKETRRIRSAILRLAASVRLAIQALS